MSFYEANQKHTPILESNGLKTWRPVSFFRFDVMNIYEQFLWVSFYQHLLSYPLLENYQDIDKGVVKTYTNIQHGELCNNG